MKTLKELHLTRKGKVSDKWSSYLDFYDRLFSSFRLEDIKLLEIGVQNGGSLETWSSYFPNAQIFVGCDINQKCRDLIYQDKKIHVVVGDANSETAYQQVRQLTTYLDVIIDDGSHQSRDIFLSFLNYFPLLKPGGLFIVEDAHTLFMNQYGGGILNNHSAQKFFYKLSDFVSYEFWSNHVSLEAFFADFFPTDQMPQFLVDGWVESVQFRNSMIVIEKAITPSHNKLGARLIAGSEAVVEPSILEQKPDSRVF
ncbi:hypothetical protein ICHIJ1_14470 [Fluviibacter phosphoraccumulans]|uniref:class I SAM-dependent methyltransferase n=1 Tax=Fluviibacter phosphoraccumulans TaxID=1751046 RepID=UPI0013673BA2|nr:class I SAM-dependent methyltransferase [Fluviibacter phosphoraccumulans]BBU71528.1 hypothetical protein ICHIJ1_14470 [Fluviibacter phosphoraccumulans]